MDKLAGVIGHKGLRPLNNRAQLLRPPRQAERIGASSPEVRPGAPQSLRSVPGEAPSGV